MSKVRKSTNKNCVRALTKVRTWRKKLSQKTKLLLTKKVAPLQKVERNLKEKNQRDQKWLKLQNNANSSLPEWPKLWKFKLSLKLQRLKKSLKAKENGAHQPLFFVPLKYQFI